MFALEFASSLTYVFQSRPARSRFNAKPFGRRQGSKEGGAKPSEPCIEVTRGLIEFASFGSAQTQAAGQSDENASNGLGLGDSLAGEVSQVCRIDI